jgi:hypothetical protein
MELTSVCASVRHSWRVCSAECMFMRLTSVCKYVHVEVEGEFWACGSLGSSEY